jgi:replicative DNA helicase
MENYDDDDSIVSTFQEQDLRIFKILTTDERLARDFVINHSPDLFLGQAKQVGAALVEYINTYKTLPTKRVLIEKYEKNSQLQSLIEEAFEQLPNVELNISEYKYDLEKLTQRYSTTKIASLRDEIRFNDRINDDQLLAECKKAIKEIEKVKSGSRSAYTQKTLSDYIHDFHHEYVAKIENKNLGQGILTGYSYLDFICNGVNPAEMLIIGGETGGGKSMLLNNMAVQMWMQQNTIATPPDQFTRGYNVLYFSLEMPFAACFRRTLARIADVPVYGLRDSTLSKAETESLNMATRFIKKYAQAGNHFEIVDVPRGVTVEQIEERYLEACARFTPDVVIVDYLGLVEDRTAEGDDWLKLGYIAGKLHEFGRAYNTRILTAVQLNRPAKNKVVSPDELIGIHRIGRSSLIMHHANVAIQIESREKEYLRDTLVYHIIKNREGELGKAEVSKNFRNAAIHDIPYKLPEKEELGVPGFEDADDISAEVRSILNI